LLEREPGGPAMALGMADLAAVGSLADVVPIIGENRGIVRLGMLSLATSPRPAFAALLQTAGVAPERLDMETIGFAIAPRLNAMSRMGDAASAARLLLTDDAHEATELAAELQAANLARRELTATSLAEARIAAAAQDGAPAIFVLGDWPVGIIGLVAGRLADEMARPAIVVTRAADPWRGSARSPAGFDLAAAFATCGESFERHGGHAAAAGFSVRPERYDAVRDHLLGLAAQLPPLDPRPALRIDLVSVSEMVDYTLFRELARLDGTGDPPPLVGITGLVIARVRAASGGHVQITLRRGREVLDGIAFGRGEDLIPVLHEGDAVDVVARLASRTYGGFESLQLEIRDVASSGTLPVAAMAA
ncbi:MAG: DHHA1 domain-containing protein, partial [Candidatus Limnocylindrales bacterium]